MITLCLGYIPSFESGWGYTVLKRKLVGREKVFSSIKIGLRVLVAIHSSFAFISNTFGGFDCDNGIQGFSFFTLV